MRGVRDLLRHADGLERTHEPDRHHGACRGRGKAFSRFACRGGISAGGRTLHRRRDRRGLSRRAASDPARRYYGHAARRTKQAIDLFGRADKSAGAVRPGRAAARARRGCGQRPCAQGQIRCRPDARGRISACTVGTDGAAAARRRSKHLLQGGCGGGALTFSLGLSPFALQP